LKFSLGTSSIRPLLALICCLLPAIAYAQASSQATVLQSHIFSYSILDTELDSVALLAMVRNDILSEQALNGGVVYATWVVAKKPVDAPFAGLAENQLGLMVAWPKDQLQQVDVLSEALQSIDAVTTVTSRLFEAIYLPAGLSVPTKAGFYVHREEKYTLEHVDDAVRLSKEAWKTWQPYWGTTVIGLFREMGGVTNVANLNRIVWYPSYDAWLDTRNFAEDKASAIRFRQRREMLVPGSGIAIATDRMLP